MTDVTPGKEAELFEFIRGIDTPAPDSLHRRIDLLIERRTSGRTRRARARGDRAAAAPALWPRLAAAGALAAVTVVALAVVLTSGTSHQLSVREASALTFDRATAAAPMESPRENGTLAAAVEGVSFPYWEDRFGWRSTGTRTDRIAGRTVQTVYYGDHGRRIGYAIVGGSGSPHVTGGRTVMIAGRPYTVSTVNGHPVITWLRDGHLCVVSGRGVDSATLLRLASWTDHDTLT